MTVKANIRVIAGADETRNEKEDTFITPEKRRVSIQNKGID